MESRPNPPVVIKIGGALVSDRQALAPMWEAISRLREVSPVVLVHGGGPQSSEMARLLGHRPTIVHGRRVTSDLDLKINQWTIRGYLNTQLVSQALNHNIPAVGVSGVDGRMLCVTKRPPWTIDEGLVDFGWVGDIQSVDTSLLTSLLEHNFLPIVAPLGVDDNGQLYNVNADTVASALATALKAGQFLLVTRAGGVRRDPKDSGSRVAVCDRNIYQAGVKDRWITDGMRVKLKVAFDTLAAGVEEVYILTPDDLLEKKTGTRILKE